MASLRGRAVSADVNDVVPAGLFASQQVAAMNVVVSFA